MENLIIPTLIWSFARSDHALGRFLTLKHNQGASPFYQYSRNYYLAEMKFRSISWKQHSTREIGLYSQGSKTSYPQISRSSKTERFCVKILSYRSGIWLAPSEHCVWDLSNFRVVLIPKKYISRLRDIREYGDKTSYRLANKGPRILPVAMKYNTRAGNGIW